MQITDYHIELREIHLYAHHGVMEQERKIGAWFTVDLNLTISDHSCAYSDSIENTVSYADVYEIVKCQMARPSNLLEDVCRRVMEAVMQQFPTISEIVVRVAKDTPPMGGDRLSSVVTMRGER